MSVMIIILLISMSIAGGFLIAFLWSVKNGQFDDDFSPAQRAIFDDKTIIKTKTNSNI
jgi:cbb3-type cytochrome oxidase maturation protein